MSNPDVQHFYHAPTGTLSYVVSDPTSRTAAVVDPVLGYSAASGRTDRATLDAILAYLDERALTLQWILETHAHADHLSAGDLLRQESGAALGIGEGIRSVQSHFAGVFNLGREFAADGSQFDRLFSDGDTFSLGGIEVSVMHTPGHTNDSVTYLVGDAAFVGDTLFMPDFGTARCDFPGGDAAMLYDSIQKILALPANTRLYMCHDYPPESRELRYTVSIAEQQADNIHIGGGRSRDDYVAMRTTRDAQLNLPALIIPAIQVNIRAGRLPPADDNDVSYLRTPIDLL